MLSRTVLVLISLCLCQLVLGGAGRHERALKAIRRQSPQQLRFGSLLGGNQRAAAPSARPGGAFGTTIPLSKGDLFVWQSKTPHNEADASSVVIVTHGVDRDANNYFTYLNDAYRTARDQNLPRADNNVLRIAPLFFATDADARSLNASTLAWGKDNDWAMGSGSTHPDGSNLSSLSVYDELVSRYSNKMKYPNVKSITFVGHGGGALVTQRFAALRSASDSSNAVPLRYVIGNPSSMLYFTTDRPGAVNEKSCDVYNLFYYGLDSYYIPYPANTNQPASLFTQYAARDVRYLVSLDDTSTTNGDQSCGARAMGGGKRKDRTLSYWKYIHLLANGATQDEMNKLKAYPGDFASLQSSTSSHQGFLTSQFNQKLSQIRNAGHEAAQVFSSKQGLSAIFGN